MPIDAYTFIDPTGSQCGRELEEMAVKHPFRFGRLVNALEEFIRSDGTAGTPAAASANPPVEIFLVPPRFVLRHIADGAVLVRADHGRQTIEIGKVWGLYGGPNEAQQFAEAQRIARTLI